MKKESGLKRHINKLIAALVVLFSSFVVIFACMYGYTNQDVHLYANLMTLDYEAKQQKDLGSIHGSIKKPFTLTKREMYDEQIDLQYKTIYRYKYYNSYLVSTTDGVINEFEVTINNANTSDSKSLNNMTVTMVKNFWDDDFMESIGIPLYWKNTDPNKNNIGTHNPAVARRGAYVSASQAYEIATKEGLLSDNSEESIKAAFDTIIAKDSGYYIKLKCRNIEESLTINNIYINPSFAYLMSDKQNSTNTEEYGDYINDFVYWNPNAIISHTPELMMNGSSFHFDIRKSYGNIKMFVENVIGKDYSRNGTTISFKTQNKELTNISNNLDRICSAKTKSNVIYLVLSIISFDLCLMFEIYLLTGKRQRNAKKAVTIFKLLLPLLSFVLMWIVGYIFVFITNNYLLLYTFGNYIGNAIGLIFLLTVVINGIIWRKSDDKKVIQ